MNARVARFAALLVLAGGIAAPSAALAAQPPEVQAWQAHRDHMASMAGPPGSHVRACIDAHGSMSGHLGPNGGWVQMMEGEMMR